MGRLAQQSAVAWGAYLILLGGGIAVAPQKMVDLFNKILVSGQLPPAGDGERSVYTRAFGVCALYIGLYHLQAARHNIVPIFELSAAGRTLILPAIHLLLFHYGAVPLAWLEAAIPTDFLAALHMIWCLRRDRIK